MARLAGLYATCWRRRWRFRCWARPERHQALGDAFVAHFDDIRACWSLWSRLPRPPPRPSARRSASSRGAGSSRACSRTLDADLVAGIGKGSRPSLPCRAVGAAIIGSPTSREAWALLTAAFSANLTYLAIGAAVTLAVVVMDNWGAVKAFLLGVWDAVASGARAAVDAVASAFNNAVNFCNRGEGPPLPGCRPGRLSAMGFAGAVFSARRICASAFGGPRPDVVSGLFSGMGATIGIALGDHGRLPALRGLAAAIFPGIFPARWMQDRAVRNFGKRPSASSGARGRHTRQPVTVGQGHGRSRTSARGRLALRKPWVRPSPVRLKPWPRRFPFCGSGGFGSRGVADTLGAAFGNSAGAASSAFSGALDVVGPAA